jgi:hypothetical protein
VVQIKNSNKVVDKLCDSNRQPKLFIALPLDFMSLEFIVDVVADKFVRLGDAPGIRVVQTRHWSTTPCSLHKSFT